MTARCSSYRCERRLPYACHPLLLVPPLSSILPTRTTRSLAVTTPISFACSAIRAAGQASAQGGSLSPGVEASRLRRGHRRGCVEAAVEAVRRGIEAYSRLTPPVVSVKASRVRRGYTSRHTLGIRRGYIRQWSRGFARFHTHSLALYRKVLQVYQAQSVEELSCKGILDGHLLLVCTCIANEHIV